MRQQHQRSGRLNTNAEDPYSICISDLMSGLLSIFILALAYYIINFSIATSQLTQNDVKRAAILQNIQKELQNRGLNVQIDPDHGVLRLPEGILFDQGQAAIKEKGKRVIHELGSVIYKVLGSREYQASVETIFIEGHTDNLPIKNAQFPSNWELSTKRAINTWSLITQSEPRLSKLRNQKNELLFSCSGYAETRPVRPNDSNAGRQENRRIDFRFTMTPPTAKEAGIIKTIKKGLSVFKGDNSK